MNEETIKELMEPIKAYINANKVEINDIRIIVQNFFPDEDKVRAIATYLNEHVQALRALGLTDDKLYGRTRQILTAALEQAALIALNDKEGYDETQDSVDYSDLDDVARDWDADDWDNGGWDDDE